MRGHRTVVVRAARLLASWSILSGAVGWAACAPPPTVPRALPTELAITPSTGDVWAWTLHVEGSAPATLKTCGVRVGEVEQPARVEGSAYRASLRLSPGENVVEARCTDASGRAWRSPTARFQARLRPAPRARIDVGSDGGALSLDATKSARDESSASPLVTFTWTASEATVKPVTARALANAPTARVDANALGPGRHLISLEVRDARGAADRARVLVEVVGTTVRVAPRDDWWERSVVYGVVPPRFGDPPLRATTAALADLADLGVSALWLSPIAATPPGDYGYAVTDYFRVREDYGTEQDLDALVAEAHRLGLRVLFDLVPNHTSAKHPYFVAAEKLGRQSHNFTFYARDAAGTPTHYFDWAHLPNLNYDHPEVRRFMLEASTFWSREHGIDGFRVDAAWGVQRRAPSFWPAWSAEVRRVRPDAFLLAEASARDPYWLTHGFDAAYDWTDELGHAAWEHVFDDPKRVVERIDEALAKEREPRDRILRFLDNNDTGPRFVTRHGVGMTRAAAALLLTLPGVPCLFTGDERGAEWLPYGPAGVIPRDDPHGLRPWWRTLIRLRTSLPALRGGKLERLPSTGTVFAFARRAGDDAAIVAINFGEQPVTMKLPASGAQRDRLGGKTIAPKKGMVDVTIGAWGAVVLAPEG